MAGRRSNGTFLKQDLATRFWSKVDRSGGPWKCWPWLAGKDKDGYGKFWVENKTVRAHRFSFELVKKIQLVDEAALHTCDHPWCCNPNHIEDGSQALNQKQKVARGRSLQGTKHHRATISEEVALAIKRLRKQGVTLRELAETFGLRKGHVAQVVKTSWKHLDDKI